MPYGDGRTTSSSGGLHAMQPATAHAVLPPPPPQRMHWSTLVLAAGMVVCFVALLATLAGVPASLGYDVDGPAERNEPSGHDPLKLQQSLDRNMKWIADNSGSGKGEYVALIKRINASEAAIAPMVQAVMSMQASVVAIDSGIADLEATHAAMRADMDEMAATSGASATTMGGLGDDVGVLSASMLELADATEQLTVKMAAIERVAAGIASNGTSAARQSTEELNEVLPAEAPLPVLEDGRVATAAGAGAADGTVAAQPTTTTASAPPTAGAQPMPPMPGGAP